MHSCMQATLPCAQAESHRHTDNPDKDAVEQERDDRFSGLSIYAIYFMVMSVDLIKCVIGFVLVKKGVWLQNIVAE